MTQPIPRYDELGKREGAPPDSSWHVWERPELGSLNRLSPADVRRAVGEVRTGRAFPLDLPVGAIDPPLFHRTHLDHQITGPDDAFARDDVLTGWNTQSGTHLDGLRHIRDELGFFGGIDGASHGLEHLAERSIVTRCVLADVAGHRRDAGIPVDPTQPDPLTIDDLEATLEAQNTQTHPGDFLLIRTGWLAWYLGATPSERMCLADRSHLAAPGLIATRDTARWIWDRGLSGVAADNPSVEVWPLGTGTDEPGLSLHVQLIARLGVILGELWNLENLAVACADDHTWSAMLVCAPMALRKGSGGPANAVVIR